MRGLQGTYRIFGFVWLCLAPLWGWAQEIAPEVHHATLKNGLRVVLCPIEGGKPEVALKLSYRVTYRDEPFGREGIRMSTLSSVVQAGGMRQKVEGLGGWWDPTNFFPEVGSQDFVLPAGKYEKGIPLIAEVMNHAADEELGKRYFKQHLPHTVRYMRPVRWTPLLSREGFAELYSRNHFHFGLLSSLDEISEEEYLEFRRRHFTPARAVVTLVGDFPAEEAYGLIRKMLGGIENPPDAIREPNEFRTFLPGVRCVVSEEKDRLGNRIVCLMGYPVPPDVPSVTARLLCVFLEKRIQERLDLEIEEFRVWTDEYPGQRLIRIGLTGEGIADRVGEIEAEIWKYAKETLETDVEVIIEAETLRQKLRKEMRSNYWISWPVGLEAQTLRWNWSSPWVELDRLRQMDPRDLQEAAERTLDPSHRLVLGLAQTQEKAEALQRKLREASSAKTLEEIRWHTAPAGFPDNPPEGPEGN